MTTITHELLEEIKAKAEKATQGEWKFELQPDGGCCLVETDGGSMAATYPATLLRKPLDAEANAAHIARMDPPTTLAIVAALEEAQRERGALRGDNERLRARLEIDHCYDIDGKRRELSPCDGDALPDGIECRDATISGLEGRIAELRAENAKLRAALEPFAVEAPKYDPQEGDDDDLPYGVNITIGNLRHARTALNETTHA